MRIVAFAAVEGNVWALEAILEAASRLGPGVETACLGNAIGDGPAPRETVALMRKRNVLLVAGPMERATLGKADGPQAREAGDANARRLGPAELAFLRSAAAPRRLSLAGWRVLLTSEETPAAPGALDVVVHPGRTPALQVREGVTWAATGRAGRNAGEAPYVVLDGESRNARVAWAAWDTGRWPDGTRHL